MARQQRVATQAGTAIRPSPPTPVTEEEEEEEPVSESEPEEPEAGEEVGAGRMGGGRGLGCCSAWRAPHQLSFKNRKCNVGGGRRGGGGGGRGGKWDT